YLLSEIAVKSYADAARAHGAEIHEQEKVRRWASDAKGVRVETDAGEYRASRLVLTAGPWTGQLGADLRSRCRPERQVLLWTEPLEPTLFQPRAFPVFNMECPEGRYYGYPDHEGEGFKIGRYHHLEQQVDNPDDMDRRCSPDDEAVLRVGI